MQRALLLLAVVGCVGQAAAPDAQPDSDGWPYPPPRSDVVPSIGSPGTLEIATWNVENFPASSMTPASAADLITSLDLDIVVVEEIASDDAWNELLARLRDHDGVLSTHRYTPSSYQKIGVIYRTSLVTPGTIELLFVDDSYAFPRPPLAVAVTIGGTRTVELVGVHLKAGTAPEDGERRRAAIARLDGHLRTQVDGGGEADVIVLGDYNEVLTTPEGRANLAPILDAPDRYTIHTSGAAADGQVSYLGFGGRLIDHVVTTAGLADTIAGATTVIPRLDAMLPSYRSTISDHIPVVVVAPLVP
jgi:hypothetical protein